MARIAQSVIKTRYVPLAKGLLLSIFVTSAALCTFATSGSAQAQRPVVQLPNGDGPNGTFDERSVDIAQGLASCSNVTNPERKNSPASAERCLINANAAIRSGQIADVPALALALRQIPFTNAAGEDFVAQMSVALAIAIEQPVRAYTNAYQQFLVERQTNPNAVQPAPVYRTNYSNPASTAGSPFAQPPEPYRIQRDPINHAPFTGPEIDAVVGRGTSFRPSAAQQPNREIPIDTGMAYLATAADAVIHPERYTAPNMTVAQTVAAARARTPAALDREIAVACFNGDRSQLLSNGDVADLRNCRAAAARNSLEMIVNGEAAPYSPARYGIPARANQR